MAYPSSPDDERPTMSDFREELEEEAYLDWCTEEGLDPDEQETARNYETWYAEQEWFSH